MNFVINGITVGVDDIGLVDFIIIYQRDFVVANFEDKTFVVRSDDGIKRARRDFKCARWVKTLYGVVATAVDE